MWFDLMTKTRQLIEQVCSPMYDRININKMQLSQLDKAEAEWRKRVEALERIVIHKDEKADAFAKINNRISLAEAERKKECHRLHCLYEGHESSLTDVHLRVSHAATHLSNLDEHLSSVVSNAADLRARTDSGLESLLAQLTRIETKFDDSLSAMSERMAKLEAISFRSVTTLEDHEKHLQEVDERVLQMIEGHKDLT